MKFKKINDCEVNLLELKFEKKENDRKYIVRFKTEIKNWNKQGFRWLILMYI